jgi:hypothetical protein
MRHLRLRCGDKTNVDLRGGSEVHYQGNGLVNFHAILRVNLLDALKNLSHCQASKYPARADKLLLNLSAEC